VNTQLGAAAAVLGWILLERLRTGRVTTIGAATGAVAGLATITPAAGFVQPLAALAIGLVAGLVCFLAVSFKGRLGYDDSLDVVGVHMVGGIIGVLLTGAFASLAINAAGAEASLTLVGKQAVLAGVTVVFSFVATMAILKVTDVTIGLRVTDEHEEAGLDSSQHGEVGYRF
jgi:ammonium transporter, Amt family